jgi:hypothetical protein
VFIRPGHYDNIYTQQQIELDQYDFETSTFGPFQFALPPEIPEQSAVDYIQQKMKLFGAKSQQLMGNVARGISSMAGFLKYRMT